jgi:DMSO/TMAO reductase YedYZ molybdopterin-dependent catalytic subunit
MGYRILSAMMLVLLPSVPVRAQDGSLRVSGEVPTPITLSASDIRGMPHVTARSTDHSGVTSNFEGVPLAAILARAGLDMAPHLRGPRLAMYLVVDAADGYRATFALAELDTAFTTRQVLLVDRKDGKALAASEGPLRIVVPDEKRAGRWVRQVVGVRVLTASE